MKNEAYYRNLSELYQLAYNEQIDVHEALMVIQGIAVEMYSDLLTYQKKNGKNDLYLRSENRINIILEKCRLLGILKTDNYNLKLINQRLTLQVSRLETELKEQHRQDELVYKFENNFNLPLTPED